MATSVQIFSSGNPPLYSVDARVPKNGLPGQEKIAQAAWMLAELLLDQAGQLVETAGQSSRSTG